MEYDFELKQQESQKRAQYEARPAQGLMGNCVTAKVRPSDAVLQLGIAAVLKEIEGSLTQLNGRLVVIKNAVVGPVPYDPLRDADPMPGVVRTLERIVALMDRAHAKAESIERSVIG